MNKRIGLSASLPGTVLTILLGAVLAAGEAHAAGGKAEALAAAPAEAAAVYTPATVRSVFAEDQGRRRYVRLKLALANEFPFTTITYRVLDPALVAGLQEGDSVAFRAERIGGENVLTAMRVVRAKRPADR
jgi:Cu/Ag efflux protein CusF